MAFHDMAGVFYAILFGLFVSLLVLLGELAWEAHKDVKESKVNSSLDFEHSLQQLTIPHIWQFSYCGRVEIGSGAWDQASPSPYGLYYCCIVNREFKLDVYGKRQIQAENFSK